jgi:hypothetical protein
MFDLSNTLLAYKPDDSKKRRARLPVRDFSFSLCSKNLGSGAIGSVVEPRY